MVIRTLPSKERYGHNKSRRGGPEHRRKLKKLKSGKVANLDRLRLSMKREKTWFVPVSSESESSSSLMMRREKTWFIPSSSESESSSSSPMSGTYSPNYMRATTSSIARKATSSRTPERRISPSSRGKSSSRLSEVSVEQCSKYYQFPDVENSDFEDNVNAYYDQDGMMKVTPKQKGFPERSLSRSNPIRLMKLMSLRTSRRHKSRFSGEATVQNHSGVGYSNAEPHYMKATSAQESRKDYVKGLARTSSLRPLRLLAKIPSLRTSKVRKRPEVGPLLGVNIYRSTCSSVLKSSKLSDHVQVNSGGLEPERFSSLHVCTYNYCSLHGHQHHAPSPPLKESVSAKRLLGKHQKGKQLENQLREKVKHSKSVKEINHLEQTVDTERPAGKEVVNTRISSYQGEKDSDMDFPINVYAKPRKNWETEGSPREDAEALNNLEYRDNNLGCYKWKLEDVLGGTTPAQAREEAITEGRIEFTERNIKSSNKTQQQTIKFEVSDSSVKLRNSGLKSSSVDKTLVPLIAEAETETQSFVKNHSHSLSTNSESISGTLTNILSDKQKYSSIWHLVYQQFKPSDEMISKDQGNRDIGEREQGGSSLDREEDNQGAPMEKTNFDQTDAINLVQEALNAILECGATPDQEMHHSPPREEIEQVGEAKQGQKVSNWSKLKKIIVTAKFIKAISNLIKKSPGKPRLLIPELTSEENKVYLRHMSMKKRKYEEEWMLDFALRKVLYRLAPDQQRRVGLLVEAFETLGPENKEKNDKFYPEKQETAPGIELVTSMDEEPKQLIESKQAVSVSEEQVPKKQDNGVPVYLKGAPQEIKLSEDHWYEASATVKDPINALRERKERNLNSKSEPIPEALLNKYSEQDCEDNITRGTFYDTQKNAGMWHLIYQRAKSVTAIEAGSPSEIVDQLESGSQSSEMIDDSDTSSVTSELGESDAVKLVKEAINDILAEPQELDNGLLSSNTVAASDESQRAGREENTLSRGFSKLRKIILCNKFIKAMEKAGMPKSNPQKRKNQILNPNPETEKVILKHCAVGETKNTGGLMLDCALQKVIAELAPVQQRRVALLVEAFEKVNPDIEEIGKRYSSTGTVSLSSTCHTKGNIDRSQVPSDADLTLQESVTTSSWEVAADSALEEIHNGNTTPSQTENLLEDEWNPSVQNCMAVDKVWHSSLWRLLVQHVNSDILDESETEKTGEIDTSGGANCTREMLEKNTDYSAEVKHNKDLNVQMPRSMSFDIQEKEAIKVVQEALDEILTCDDQPMTTTITLDQDSCIENHGSRGKLSPSTEEIEEVQTSVDSVAKPKEEQELAKEKLSKVILCKRFIKAMDKMRKLKAQSPQDQTQKLQLENKIVRPMRQTASNHRKNWEEWMLDRAMQKVVGELAPVQKKKVSLLVQAFEKVSSQPEPRNDKKGQAVGL